jgi:hypothetical protein
MPTLVQPLLEQYLACVVTELSGIAVPSCWQLIAGCALFTSGKYT